MGPLGFQLNDEQRAFAAEHVRLAYSETHKFSRRTGISYEDLIGAAHIGLAKGAYGWDASLGYKPSTFLVAKIRGELLHHCRDRTYLLRISHRLRELWMRGRKFIPYGHSDIYIAKKLGIELEEWLECKHVCSGPPLQLNETVHEVTCPGYHGKPQIVEDDRTGAYLDAVRMVWENSPKVAAKLFWACKGLGMAETRVECLESMVEAACDVLDGYGLPAGEEEDLPLRAASYDGTTDQIDLHFEDEDLGNGRIQGSLF